MEIIIDNNENFVLPETFLKLSTFFKPETKIPISLETITKIKEFGEYYLTLPAEDQDKIISLYSYPGFFTDDKQIWLNKFFNISTDSISLLMDLMNQSNKLEIEPLKQVCAYIIASIIKGKNSEELKQIFLNSS